MAADSSHHSNQHAIPILRNSQDWNSLCFQFLAQLKLMLCLQNAEQATGISNEVPQSTILTSGATPYVLQQYSEGSWPIGATVLVNLIPYLFQAFKTFSNQVKYDFKNDEEKAEDEYMIEMNSCAAVVAYVQDEQDSVDNIIQAPEPQAS
jgi:hypothetical protein